MNWLTPLDTGLVSGLIFAWAVLALASAFRLLNFPDITVEGSVPLGAAAYASVLTAGWPPTAALGSAFVVGGVAGALTAILHVRFNVNKLLAGIIVISIAYTGCLRIMGTSNIGLLQYETLFNWIEHQTVVFPFHLGTILVLAMLLITGIAFLYRGLVSRQGLRMRVAGVNPDHARSLGINVPLNLTAGLALSNGFAALTGVLIANRQGFADVGMGRGVLILALASMVIGERLISTRWFSFPMYVLLAAIVGSIVYQVVVAFAVRLGVPSTDLELLTAVLVLIVVARTTSRQDSELLPGL